MEILDADWRVSEISAVDGPSVDFILAVAFLLESDDDLLKEMGYINPVQMEQPASER